MKESQVKTNLKTKKEPDNGNKDEANFLVESVGSKSFSGELEVPETDQPVNRQKRIQLNHMKESQGKMNLKT